MQAELLGGIAVPVDLPAAGLHLALDERALDDVRWSMDLARPTPLRS